RADDCGNVRKEDVAAEFAGHRQVDEAWSADVDPVRDRAALGFDVEAQVPARVFVFGVDFAGRDLHRAGELGAEGAVGDLRDALPQDADALLHLLHLHVVPIPAIAELALGTGADADVEVELLVDAV